MKVRSEVWSRNGLGLGISFTWPTGNFSNGGASLVMVIQAAEESWSIDQQAEHVTAVLAYMIPYSYPTHTLPIARYRLFQSSHHHRLLLTCMDVLNLALPQSSKL